jgi:1-acyl-sn-glycerol-3-phosphate acyltransferase
MSRALRYLFFVLVVRPLVLVGLGLNVRHRERLPASGPAIFAANHNSHLDTLVLMILFPLRLLPRLRPVAAADYFLRGRLLAWFSTRILGIVPLSRTGGVPKDQLLAGVSAAVEAGDLVILFPEGTRGEPERLARFKTGVAHLAVRHPAVPVVPIFLHGLGKALPRGEALLVPFFCDVFVGEPFTFSGKRRSFMDTLEAEMARLASEGSFPPWE